MNRVLRAFFILLAVATLPLAPAPAATASTTGPALEFSTVASVPPVPGTEIIIGQAVIPPAPLPTPVFFGGADTLPQAAFAEGLVQPQAVTGDDKTQADQTAWWMYSGVTAAQLSAALAANSARPVDIRVDQTSPVYLFTATMVSNTGAYAKGWWWYYDVSAGQVSSLLGVNNARLSDIIAIDVGGTPHFTVIMVPNTGADAKSWWWYFNVTPSDLTNAWIANNARLISLSSYNTTGGVRYAAVMIHNTGADAKSWWWYVGATAAEMITHLQTNNAQLFHLTYNPVSDRFDGIMVGCACAHWWWYYNLDANTALNTALQNGARATELQAYQVAGQTRFSLLLINNSDPITTRVGDILRNSTDGTKGLYLKQVGGSVLAALEDSYAFEPASSIKVTLHLYALRQVAAGAVPLTKPVVIYNPTPGSSCPSNTANGTETLENSLQQMMWNSDNQRTKAISATFGINNVNAMSSGVVGMSNTRVQYTLGCGPKGNTMTLDDAGLLYEKVANNTLLPNSTLKAKFYQLMAGKNYDFTGVWGNTQTIIAQEAPVGMTSAQKLFFAQQIEMSYKAGSYEFCGNGGCNVSNTNYLSLAGWVKIPFCTAGVQTPKEYVFGIFIDGSTHPTTAGNTFNAAKAELLREQIRAALLSQQSCLHGVYLPIVKR